MKKFYKIFIIDGSVEIKPCNLTDAYFYTEKEAEEYLDQEGVFPIQYIILPVYEGKNQIF